MASHSTLPWRFRIDAVYRPRATPVANSLTSRQSGSGLESGRWLAASKRSRASAISSSTRSSGNQSSSYASRLIQKALIQRSGPLPARVRGRVRSKPSTTPVAIAACSSTTTEGTDRRGLPVLSTVGAGNSTEQTSTCSPRTSSTRNNSTPTTFGCASAASRPGADPPSSISMIRRPPFVRPSNPLRPITMRIRSKRCALSLGIRPCSLSTGSSPVKPSWRVITPNKPILNFSPARRARDTGRVRILPDSPTQATSSRARSIS